MFRRIVWVSIPATLGLAAATAYKMQQNAEAHDWKSLVSPGKMYQLNRTTHIHAVVRGHGSPVVVLEASTAGLTQDYSQVIDAIAKFTTVVAYDRAGLGFSSNCDAATLPQPRSAEQLSKEFSQLLESIPELDTRMGVIVVGHGHGAAITIEAARNRRVPNLAGVVLLDPVCGVQAKHRGVSSDISEAIEGMQSGTKTLAQLSMFGIARIFMSLPNSIQNLSNLYQPKDCIVVQALSSRSTHRHTVCSEVTCYADDDNALETLIQSGSLLVGEDVPVLVVGHGNASMFTDLASVGDGDKQERLERLEKIWSGGQQDLTRALSNTAMYVRAANTEHSMPQKNVDLTVEAVRAVFNAAGGGGTSKSGKDRVLAEFKQKHHTNKVRGVRVRGL